MTYLEGIIINPYFDMKHYVHGNTVMKEMVDIAHGSHNNFITFVKIRITCLKISWVHFCSLL